MAKKQKKTKESLQDRIDRILYTGDTLAGMYYSFFMGVLVFIVSFTFVLSTYHLKPYDEQMVFWVDRVITVFFFVDYLVRWWAKKFSIRYLFTPLALIDLVSVLPLFFWDQHFQIVRILRVFRVLRLVRIFQGKSFLVKRFSATDLQLMRIFFTIGGIIFISSGLIYDVEHKHNPEVMKTFFDALYFTCISLSTVGYGDIVPVSTAGKAVSLLMIGSGVLLIPWELTTLARYFVRERYLARARCKACGLTMHEVDANYCKICGGVLEREEFK